MNIIHRIGWTGISVAIIALFAFIAIFLFRGGISFIENHLDFLTTVNEIIFLTLLLLLAVSLIPKTRIFTGMSIVYITSVWIFLFWLNCLAVTYAIWGILGMIIGVVFFGLGIFATAILALLFSGQWIGAVIIFLNLMIMYGMRRLGVWIIKKYPDGLAVKAKIIE